MKALAREPLQRLHHPNYALEYITLCFAESEAQGIAAWIEAFVLALNELDLSLCRRLVSMAKQQRLSSSGAATIVFNEALIYIEQQNWDDALSRLEICLDVRQSLEDKVGASEALFQIGYLYRQTSDYTRSRGAFLKSLSIAESLEEANRMSPCLHELGQVFEVQGEYKAANAMYGQSLKMGSNSWETTRSQYRLGFINQLNGDFDAARQVYETCCMALDGANPRQQRTKADIEYQLGMSYYEQGNFVKAESHFESTLDILNQLNAFGVAQGRALQGLGRIYQVRGDRTNALKLFGQAEDIFEEFVSEEDRANILLQRGVIELEREHPHKAMAHFDSARGIFEGPGNKLGLADALYGLGNACAQLGEHSRALDYFHHALREYRVMGNRLKISSTLYKLGIILSTQGDREAGEHLQQALRIARDIGSRPIVADCMLGLGRLYHQRKDTAEARDYYYPQSLALYESMNLKPRVAEVFFELGQLYYELRQLDTAQEHYLHSVHVARVICEHGLALRALLQLELVSLQSGRYADAYRFFEQEQQMTSAFDREDLDA